MKQYNKGKDSSPELTPIQASRKKIERYVHQNFQTKEKSKNQKKLSILVRTSDSKKTFSNSDMTNGSHNFCKIRNYLLIQLQDQK